MFYILRFKKCAIIDLSTLNVISTILRFSSIFLLEPI